MKNCENIEIKKNRSRLVFSGEINMFFIKQMIFDVIIRISLILLDIEVGRGVLGIGKGLCKSREFNKIQYILEVIKKFKVIRKICV